MLCACYLRKPFYVLFFSLSCVLSLSKSSQTGSSPNNSFKHVGFMKTDDLIGKTKEHLINNDK